VAGTMWALADVDGQFLAKNFYDSLFSERWKGVPYYERTAEALRDALKELERKKASIERWANFVFSFIIVPEYHYLAVSVRPPYCCA